MTVDTMKLYGPPGTGKTHNGLDWLSYQVRQGAHPQEIAFVSYTNAACDEARRRMGAAFDFYDWELPYCATLHALCRRALGVEGKEWNAEQKLRAFGQEYSYQLGLEKRSGDTEDLIELGRQQGKDAPLMQMLHWGRNRCLPTPDATYRAFGAYDGDALLRLDYGRFVQFWTDYNAWKTENDYRDFTDLLEQVVAQKKSLPVTVVALDEAQDQTPLLWQAYDTLFARAEQRAALGDDDQAIFSFQGCDPALFNARSSTSRYILEQSYRLPSTVVALAEQIISRCRNRVHKVVRPVTPAILRSYDVEPTPDRLSGSVNRVADLGGLPLRNDGTWMLLCRNWCFVDPLALALEDLGIPYAIAGGQRYTPWSDKGPLRAARAILTLAAGGRIDTTALAALVDKTESATSIRAGAWRYGAKKPIETLVAEQPDLRFTLLDLPHLGLTEWAFDRIALADLTVLARISDRDRNAYQMAQCSGGLVQEPWVTVSTIHGVKGQEADHVACWESATRMPIRNLQHAERCDEEYRLAYVAVTRASQSFWAVSHDGSGQPYPVFPV